MRAFVAMEVPDEVLDSLASFQHELSAAGADLKLVERGNLHFTLKFLGEISEAQARDADSRLRGLSLKSATVGVAGAGAFPSASRPRVIWVGVAKGQEESFLPTARSVIDSLNGIGEEDDRPFRLHLTVARVRSDRNLDALRQLLLSSADRTFGTARLTAVKLKSSQLTPSGPIYSDVGAYPLL